MEMIIFECRINIKSLDGAKRYGARATGAAPGVRSIRNSTDQSGDMELSMADKVCEENRYLNPGCEIHDCIDICKRVHGPNSQAKCIYSVCNCVFDCPSKKTNLRKW
ncbi:uncharacterized protein LOC112502437 [Cynara cardunculus var. scolymus]|uniref:uncharacterized protein LOC112502437 n=1 Tax=Cynara cardunculus var. scolymus TaxID=59895 RepID=UPI000D62A20C|nr:uncharacterized protein LOC112502437 [Cynara cardunculus var. scolymus]